MKKLALLALVAMLGMSAPAFAQATAADKAADVNADVGAVQKDNAAIAHDDQNLATNRADKAAAKANGDVGQQAVDSVKIGANKTARSEKKTEKDVDQHILNHDEQQ